jgi:hypothetical protein
MLKRLWEDEGGAIISAELVLVMTILVMGMMVGLVALRDAVVTELADTAASIGALQRSWSFNGIALSDGPVGSQTYVGGCAYSESADADQMFSDTGWMVVDVSDNVNFINSDTVSHP